MADMCARRANRNARNADLVLGVAIIVSAAEELQQGRRLLLHGCRFGRDFFLLQTQHHDLVEERETRFYIAHRRPVGLGFEQVETRLKTDNGSTVHGIFVNQGGMQILQFTESIERQLQMSTLYDSFTMHHLIEVMQLRRGIRLLRKRAQVVLQLP